MADKDQLNHIFYLIWRHKVEHWGCPEWINKRVTEWFKIGEAKQNKLKISRTWLEFECLMIKLMFIGFQKLSRHEIW